MLNQGRNITHPNHQVHENSKVAFQMFILSNKHLTYKNQILKFLEEVNEPYSRRMIAEETGIVINCVTSPILTMIKKGVLHVSKGKCKVSDYKGDVELLVPMEHQPMEQKKEPLQKQLL